MEEHTPSCELRLLQGEYESTNLGLTTYTILVALDYISKHLLGLSFVCEIDEWVLEMLSDKVKPGATRTAQGGVVRLLFHLNP